MTALPDLLDRAWTALEAGAAPGRSRFSMVYLATTGLDGAPRLRTVVLRRADRAAGTAGFNTDLRSPKIAEMRAEPRAALLGYDMEAGFQVRLEGRARLLPQDGAAWEAALPRSRICYRHAYAPGSRLERPEDGDPTEAMIAPEDADSGLPNFCAVDLLIERLEALDLSATGHRRAEYRATEGWAGRWLAP
ncbi:MAG: pyridoxamine 5'-phosphate oxidase family protein [Pikeienuella sp.]|uniref:pyridoxamine 5'-phosphate oxidase family protein n=1 Tax=Pikeienuella sp. TaxID=2831957 RepID=UPI00391B6995